MKALALAAVCLLTLASCGSNTVAAASGDPKAPAAAEHDGGCCGEAGGCCAEGAAKAGKADHAEKDCDSCALEAKPGDTKAKDAGKQ